MEEGKMEQEKIILATTSPSRREAFEFLNIPFTAKGSKVEEKFEQRSNSPKALVLCLSEIKATAVAKKHLEEQTFIFGFDSVGFHKNKILEKPANKAAAKQRLLNLSGQKHSFLTGLTLLKTGGGRVEQLDQRVVETEVKFRELALEEVEQYLNKDPHFKTYALGYNPVAFVSSSFIEEINGSPTNIMRGIPLNTAAEMLSNFGLYPAKEIKPKIVICASSAFRKEMVEYKAKLKELGLTAIVHPLYEEVVKGEHPDFLEKIKTEHGAIKREYGFVQWYFDQIKTADGILVLNLEKNGVNGYVGVNTASEMLFALYCKKVVFLLNPAQIKCPSYDEVMASTDLVLNGDLSQIKERLTKKF